MARQRVNLEQYSVGSALGSGWTMRQNNGSGGGVNILDSGNGKVLQTPSTGSGTKVAAYDALNDIDDVEMLVKFRLASDVGKQGIVSIRYGGTNESNTTGYTLSGSFINSAGQLAIDEGSTGYVTWTPWNYLPNITYWVRFRVVGTRISAKVWTDGNAEPSSWMIDQTNTLRSTGDYSGLHQYNTGTITYFYISYGTGGSTAPAPGENLDTRIITPSDITWDPTNNYYDGRPEPVTTIAIHWWDDPALNPTMEGVISWFKNPDSEVSAHYVVSDDRIVQMVSLDDRALHVSGHNNYTIGIEVNPNLPEGTYESVAGLVRYLRLHLNKPLPLKGHNEFSGTNTQCPGDVDVSLIQTMSEEEIPEGTITVPPVSNFTASPVSGETPLSVSFIDTSTNSPESWLWNFGDSETTPTTYGFESGALTPFTTSGNGNWTVVTDSKNSGTYAAKSADVADSQVSTLSLSQTLTNGGTVKFNLRVSSEVDFDYLRFYIDDVKQDAWSGDTGWIESSLYYIPSGTHTLAWKFEKDTAVTTNLDRAWVDDIVITPASETSSSTTRNPTHVYQDPGTYTVSLLTTNENGTDLEQKDSLITAVLPPPSASGRAIKYQDGTEWKIRTIRAYDGTEWVRRPVKVWNGTDWE